MDTDIIYSFGEWIKQRRKQLRLTQRELAVNAHCSVAMIKKIEADERQPSPELAELLAAALQVPPEQQAQFVDTARGRQPVDKLAQDGLVTIHNEVDVAPGSDPIQLVLPQTATPFIGREKELAAITSQLNQPDCRLLTLLGPGGIGKTRLAMETAFSMESSFADGAVFVSLAAISAEEDIPSAIARALNISLVSSVAPEDQLRRFLSQRKLLLVLDNIEHLVAGAAILARLLAAAPQLKLLVTSRERLNLAGEWLYPVPGFTPDAAAQLFAAQAHRVNGTFDSVGQTEAINQICQLVGGHPLALELAASWTRLMSPQQIAVQIAQDLDFLTGGPRDLPFRHQSLRALFEHSWVLLSPQERDGLAKLSVFRGGFAQEQAAAVAGLSWPLLLGLADKSLLEAVRAKRQGQQRFDLHELTRQFATAKLVEQDALQAVQQQHFQVYSLLARDLAEQRIGPQAISSANRFEEELDNFHQALDWGLTQGLVNETLAMTEDLFSGWLRGGHWLAAERWIRAAVAQAGAEDSVQLCSGLCALAALAAIQGHFQEIQPLVQRALPMAQRLGEPWPLALTYNLIGQSSTTEAETVAAYEKLIAICQEHNTYLFSQFLTDALRLYGDRLMSYGSYAAAEVQYRKSLALYRALGDVYLIAYPLGSLGRMALLDGRLDEAHQLIAESVRFARSGGSAAVIGDWLFRLGIVHLYLGDLEAAAADLQEAAALYEEIGSLRGRADVLACLAEVALESDNVAQAAAYIKSCFTFYQQLLASASGSYLEDYGFDTADDLLANFLRAGLLKTAQKEYTTAAMLFSAVTSWQERLNHRAVQPLEERVATVQAIIRQNLSESKRNDAQAVAGELNIAAIVNLILQ